MNLRELFEQSINEIKMSPGSLRSQAANLNALVAIEYEMVVTGFRSGHAYAGEQPVNSFQDIEEFFGQNNSSRTVNRVIYKLEKQYDTWVRDDVQDEFDSVQGERWFVKWLEENVSEKTVAEEMDVDREDVNYWDFMEYCQKESFGNHWYKTAFDEYVEQVRYNQKLSQENFLKDQGLTTIGAVYDEFQYDLEMPSDISEETYGNVANSLEQLLNKEVDWSSTYHGADRDEGCYIVEPDSSIIPTSEGYDLPVEIVSPPQSITDSLADYRKIRSWAIVDDHYTNSSTGLHINVSLPNFSYKNLQLHIYVFG